MARLNLVSPWIEYYHKMKAMFEDDSRIRIVFDDDAMELRFYAETDYLLDTLEKLIPSGKIWGDVTLTNVIIPPNDKNLRITHCKEQSPSDLFTELFYNNPHFLDVFYINTILSNGITYVVFKKEVIQYYSDNLSDAHGVTSVLMEDLARELLNTPDGVFYCTDVK